MLPKPSVKTLLTFEEFEALPEYRGKQELLEGELIELPPPEFEHGRIVTDIFLRLHKAILAAHSRGEAAELGRAFRGRGYRLGVKTWTVPDVSLSYAQQPEGKYLQGSPAIAIEIISPRNMAEDIDEKIALYFEHGAREVWCLYRTTRHVVVHVPGGSRVVADRVTTPLLPGFVLDVGEIFGH